MLDLWLVILHTFCLRCELKETSEGVNDWKPTSQQAQKHPRKISICYYILLSTSDGEKKYPFAYCPAGIYNTALRALQWKNALGWNFKMSSKYKILQKKPIICGKIKKIQALLNLQVPEASSLAFFSTIRNFSFSNVKTLPK